MMAVARLAYDAWAVWLIMILAAVWRLRELFLPEYWVNSWVLLNRQFSRGQWCHC